MQRFLFLFYNLFYNRTATYFFTTGRLLCFFFIHLFCFSVLEHENVRQTTEIQPNAPAEGSNRWKCWFEKLTFAISRERLTLAGQEIAALQDSYQRGLLVSMKYLQMNENLINNPKSQDALLPAARHELFLYKCYFS